MSVWSFLRWSASSSARGSVWVCGFQNRCPSTAGLKSFSWSPSGHGEGEAFEVLLGHLRAHAPAVDRVEHLAQLRLGIGREHEALAGAPPRDPPPAILELGGNALVPEGEILREVPIEGALGALEGGEVPAENVGIAPLVHPPQRVELAVEDLPQPEVLGHVDLRIEQAGRLHLALEERIQPASEAAHRSDLDVLEGHELLEA